MDRWFDFGMLSICRSACATAPRGAQLVAFRDGRMALCDCGRIVVIYDAAA